MANEVKRRSTAAADLSASPEWRLRVGGMCEWCEWQHRTNTTLLSVTLSVTLGRRRAMIGRFLGHTALLGVVAGVTLGRRRATKGRFFGHIIDRLIHD
jgi:hypothetical protein